MTDTLTERLIEIIRIRSFMVRNKPFKLKSGAVSNLYFNMKPTMLDGEGSGLVGELMFRAIEKDLPYAVGGPAVGAVPLIPPLTNAAIRHHRYVEGFYVLDQAKDHGVTASIQGLMDGEDLKQRTVVVLEDVTTTGGSAMKAVNAVRAAGGHVTGVLSILDRDEGAANLFRNEGLAYTALTNKRQFVEPEREIFIPADKVAEWEASRSR
jgi:orotate phosphoribosyltransferase